MNKEPKLCKDCEFFKKLKCTHSKSIIIDFVEGNDTYSYAKDMRIYTHGMPLGTITCGPEATWFKQKLNKKN